MARTRAVREESRAVMEQSRAYMSELEALAGVQKPQSSLQRTLAVAAPPANDGDDLDALDEARDEADLVDSIVDMEAFELARRRARGEPERDEDEDTE